MLYNLLPELKLGFPINVIIRAVPKAKLITATGITSPPGGFLVIELSSRRAQHN